MLELPLPFTEQIKTLLPDEWSLLEQSLQKESPVSIRLNNKANVSPPCDQIPWSNSGYYLPARPLFTADPLLHAGVYYVQEAGSMFLEQAIKQHIKSSAIALDLCAAPGGKATHLSQLLPEGSFLIANETIRSRAHILAENILKWGNPDIAVTNNSASDLGNFSSIFDLIVADVPCSGEGMFRKDPDSVKEWSPANVQLCAARQRSIIGDIWPALKEGGTLIYSTCTYNRTENEENVKWIASELGATTLPIDVNPAWGITECENGYRFYPHKSRSEGFFMAILKKISSGSASTHFKSQSNPPAAVKSGVCDIYLKKHNWNFRNGKFGIYAFNAQYEELVTGINAILNPLFIGIPMGEIKGKDFIPHHAIAMSKALSFSNIPTAEVAYHTAISYLKREAISLDNAPKGYLLITYRDVPLGWVKNLGTRANNLYPPEWRIRMNITQKDPLKIFDLINGL